MKKEKETLFYVRCLYKYYRFINIAESQENVAFEYLWTMFSDAKILHLWKRPMLLVDLEPGPAG